MTIRCRGCSEVSEKKYDERDVEYCWKCGEKLYNNCIYCGKAGDIEGYFDTAKRCSACNFPLRVCVVCGKSYDIGRTTCDKPGCNSQPLQGRARLFVGGNRYVNQQRNNVYTCTSIQTAPELDGRRYIKTGVPLAINDLLYFWALDTADGDRWCLHNIHVTTGNMRLTDDEGQPCIAINSPNKTEIFMDMYGRYLVSATAEQCWVHDAYSGEEMFYTQPLKPFSVCIDNSTRYVLQATYDSRNGTEQVHAHPLTAPNEKKLIVEYSVAPRITGRDYPPVLAWQGAFYFCGYESGAIRLQWEAGRYTATTLAAVKDKQIFQIGLLSDTRLFFTYYDQGKGNYYWGTCLHDGSGEYLHNKPLQEPFVSAHLEEGLLQQQPGEKGMQIVFQALKEGRKMESTPSVKVLDKIKTLHDACVIETGNGDDLAYVYCCDSPYGVFGRVPYIDGEFKNSREFKKTPGSFTGKPFNYFVCIGDKLFIFIREMRATIMQVHEL